MENNKKFNILHIDSFEGYGGAQKDISVLLSSMKLTEFSERFNLFVVHNNNKMLGEELTNLNIPNFSIKMKNFMDIRAIMKIRRFLIDYNIELINFHSSRDHFLGGIASLLSGKRIIRVLTRHVAYKISPFKGFLIYRLLTDYFIAVGVFIKNILIDSLRIEPDKISVIHSPRTYASAPEILELEAQKEEVRKELGAFAGVPIVSVIGRLSREKGHLVFLKAARIVLRSGLSLTSTKKDHAGNTPDIKIKFVIIGEGEMLEKIHEFININNMSDYFILTGFKKDIKKYIYVSDVIVVPSGLEGMGSIIIESCSLKKAVIASDVGGIPEIIRDNDTGLLFKNGDYASLAEKIIYCLNRKNIMERLGSNCYNKVVNEFDAVKIAKITAMLYLKLLN